MKLTVRNAPIKTYKVELELTECYDVVARNGSAFQPIKVDNGKAIVLADDIKTGTLVTFTANRDTYFQVVPPSCVNRNSDDDVTSVLIQEDVPMVRLDNNRVDFDSEKKKS